MKNHLLVIVLSLMSLSAFAQADFDTDLDTKKLTIYNLQGVKNLSFDIEIKNKHASVLIIIYEGKGSRSIVIGDSGTQSIATTGVEKVEIVHRNKFIFRYKQKLTSEPEIKSKKKIKSSRVRVSSGSSSSTTSTTVEST